MTNRMKEEERVEKIIRSLLKLPENRRCINCNSMGPQYVCTTFLTFVCTNCSGVHREFTHRVKSVSMAKFSGEEVSALQAGGNERARQVYFKGWDPQLHSYPDSSNLHKLRDFIKHVYVDKKFTGERSMDNFPRLRLTEESSQEIKKFTSHQGRSRSPDNEDRFESCYSERLSPLRRNDYGSSKYYYNERRSPGYSQSNSRSGGFRRNPVRIEVVDNRIREDGREGVKYTMGESKPQSRSSPESKNNFSRRRASLHAILPVKEILGENVPPIQNITSSSGQDSTSGNAVENKMTTLESLIDFDSNSNTQENIVAPSSQALNVPPSHDDANWASFPTKEATPGPAPSAGSTVVPAQQAPCVNTLESLLFELSVPSSSPASNQNEGSNNDGSPLTRSSTITGLPTNLQIQPFGMTVSGGEQAVSTGPTLALPAPVNGPTDNAPGQFSDAGVLEATSSVSDGQQLQNMQQVQPSTSPIVQQNAGPIAFEPWDLALPSDPQEASTNLSKQTSEPLAKPVETKSSERKELPMDLFALSFSATTPLVSGPQTGQVPYNIGGYGFQYYPNASPVSAFSKPVRSINPFDISDGQDQRNIHPFPSMASLQGTLANVPGPTTGLISSSSSFPTHPSGFMMPHSSAVMPPQSQSFAPPSSANMGQPVYTNMLPSPPQGLNFGSFNSTQNPANRYSAPCTPNSSSKGGNPFG